MKSTSSQLGIAILLCLIHTTLFAQNADEIIYNQYKQSYYYVGGSFVIDTGQATVKSQKRAFLIWASNLKPDTLNRRLALSEYGPAGNYIAEKSTASHNYASTRTLFPKKVIRSKYTHSFYLLGYIINSSHQLNKLTVNSTPVVYKIDGNTLNQIWSARLHFSSVTPNNAGTVIEYNDIIETKDSQVVIVGKYATNAKQKENVLATKLSGSSGGIVWQYYYSFGNSCSEGANAAAETSDGRISLTGYVRRCDSLSVSGPADLFYTQITSAGLPVAGTYKRYAWQGKLNLWADNISSYYKSPGKDQLLISGYVDMPGANTSNKQILIANLAQDGSMISFNAVGDVKEDVARDLIYQPIVGTKDYNLYLTGSTASYNSAAVVSSEAYFLYLRFNALTGVTGVKEMSVYPVFTTPYNNYSGRTGIELKNISKYRRFAILVTGDYKLDNSTGTYTNVLVRDFDDLQNACIKQYQPPFTSFEIKPVAAGARNIKPGFVRYKEGWGTLGPLTVKQLCQQVKIDPYTALASTALTAAASVVSSSSIDAKTTLVITPNPVENSFTLHTSAMDALSGKQGHSVVQIFNAAMQLMQSISVPPNVTTMSVTADKLKPGLYMVQLVQPGKMVSGKFIKK